MMQLPNNLKTFPEKAPSNPDQAYLDLLKRCLLNWLYSDVEDVMARAHGQLAAQRLAGKDWPLLGHSMIGLARLQQVEDAVETILGEGIPGDFLEAGVWRGGTCILMRAILHLRNIQDRTIWAADSFAGLPPPDPARYPADAGMTLHQFPQLAVSLPNVKAAFARYGLLDDQVQFLQGWFKDTLPTAPVKQLALLRADGDLYESTMDILTNLYPKVVTGGLLPCWNNDSNATGKSKN